MIASKYASALLKYVDETGSGEKTFNQVRSLDSALDSIEQFRSVIFNPVSVSKENKLKACETVLQGETMTDELSRFLSLVIDNGRVQHLRLILKSFMERYLKSRNIHIVHLTTAIDSEELSKKISDLVKRNTGGDVILQTKVDPDLIGGFVFRCDDLMLDASVRSQLDAIKRQFIEKNRRIV